MLTPITRPVIRSVAHPPLNENAILDGEIVYFEGQKVIYEGKVVTYKEANTEPEPEYLYVASGSGLSPDIDGLRFYDSGGTLNGYPVHKSESTELSVDGAFTLFVSGGFPESYQINIVENDSSYGGWYVTTHNDFNVVNTYGAFGGENGEPSGTLTISSI